LLIIKFKLCLSKLYRLSKWTSKGKH